MLPVDDMNTRYGPMSFFTVGRGMAAASSIATSSAYALAFMSAIRSDALMVVRTGRCDK